MVAKYDASKQSRTRACSRVPQFHRSVLTGCGKRFAIRRQVDSGQVILAFETPAPFRVTKADQFKVAFLVRESDPIRRARSSPQAHVTAGLPAMEFLPGSSVPRFDQTFAVNRQHDFSVWKDGGKQERRARMCD